MSSLRSIILSTLLEAAKKRKKSKPKAKKAKSATLSAAYDSDLRLALFNLKQRNIVKSNGKFRKKGDHYYASVKYNGSKADLKDAVINFYGRFVKVV